MRIRIFLSILAMAVLFIFSSLIAGTTGKIAGTIKDNDTGEELIGANILIEGTTMGASTDKDGYFVILNVPPGTYTLSVYYLGYAPLITQNVKVSVDRTTTLHVKLTSEAITGEEIVVQAVRPAIEMDRTNTAAIIGAETVESMPVTEVEEVLELQAGVVKIGGELHFRGGRAREVAYVIDGVPVNNSFSESGGSLVEIENNMIEELEIISGGFNAEYGQAQSAVVNIVTKRPASTFSGTVNAYLGDWLSRKDDIYLGISKINPAGERNVDFSLTGPIISDKLGFVVNARYHRFESVDNYERRFNSADGWKIAAYREWAVQNDISDGTVIPIPDSLATGDLSRGSLAVTDYGSLQAKLRFGFSPKINLTYTGFGSFQETLGPWNSVLERSGSFFRYAPDNFGTIQQWSYSHFLRFQHSPSDKFFYNLAASYQREDGDYFYRKDNKIAQYPGDDGIQLIGASSSNGSGNVFNLGSTGGFYGSSPGQGYIDQYLVQGDLNLQFDKYNFIKAGFSVTQIIADIYYRGFRLTPAWQNRRWPLQTEISPADSTWDAYWNALVDYWKNWDDTYGERVVEVGRDEVALYADFQVKPLEIAAYIQDKVELSNEIIINAGVRLDYFQPNEKVPINLRTEASNLGTEVNLKQASAKYQLSPRLGISFPVSSTGKFHAYYGHFFQMPAYERMYNEPLITVNRIQLEGRRLGNADLEPEKTVSYEIGLQQTLTRDIAISVTTYYKDFKNLLGIEQITTIDQVTYTRYINRDHGNSKGITIDLTKRNGFVTGGMNYTLAYANGSSSDPAALVLIQSATRIGGGTDVFPEREILPLNWDQRLTLNGYLNFIKEDNWTIGLVGSVNSGTVYSPDPPLERFDVPERELRNSAYKPTRWTVDLKMRKYLTISGFKTALYLKVDNLFDNLNHEQVFPISGKADEIAKLPEETQRDVNEIVTEGLFTVDEVYTYPGNFSFPRKFQLGLEFHF